jgi:hypothetical protein
MASSRAAQSRLAKAQASPRETDWFVLKAWFEAKDLSVVSGLSGEKALEQEIL